MPRDLIAYIIQHTLAVQPFHNTSRISGLAFNIAHTLPPECAKSTTAINNDPSNTAKMVCHVRKPIAYPIDASVGCF